MHLAQDRHPRGIYTGIQSLKRNGASMRDVEDDAYKKLLSKLHRHEKLALKQIRYPYFLLTFTCQS